MPRCEGLPDGPCPGNVIGRCVKNCQVDLFICPECERTRFPSVNSTSTSDKRQVEKANHATHTTVRSQGCCRPTACNDKLFSQLYPIQKRNLLPYTFVCCYWNLKAKFKTLSHKIHHLHHHHLTSRLPILYCRPRQHHTNDELTAMCSSVQELKGEIDDIKSQTASSAVSCPSRAVGQTISRQQRRLVKCGYADNDDDNHLNQRDHYRGCRQHCRLETGNT